jgi:hypothetical protein
VGSEQLFQLSESLFKCLRLLLEFLDIALFRPRLFSCLFISTRSSVQVSNYDYHECPNLAQLPHFGLAESHFSFRLRQTRHAVRRFVLSSAAGGAMSLDPSSEVGEVFAERFKFGGNCAMNWEGSGSIMGGSDSPMFLYHRKEDETRLPSLCYPYSSSLKIPR